MGGKGFKAWVGDLRGLGEGDEVVKGVMSRHVEAVGRLFIEGGGGC